MSTNTVANELRGRQTRSICVLTSTKKSAVPGLFTNPGPKVGWSSVVEDLSSQFHVPSLSL